MDEKEFKKPFLIENSSTKYQVGQVWNYKTRTSEPNSTFTVVRVEDSGIGVIVHIYIDNVNVRTNPENEELTSVISHSPFSEAALDSSVIELKTSVSQLPEYKEGYEEWKNLFLQGNASVFTIPIKQSIKYMEQTMLHGHAIDKP